jgi:hypothetical protein
VCVIALAKARSATIRYFRRRRPSLSRRRGLGLDRRTAQGGLVAGACALEHHPCRAARSALPRSRRWRHPSGSGSGSAPRGSSTDAHRAAESPTKSGCASLKIIKAHQSGKVAHRHHPERTGRQVDRGARGRRRSTADHGTVSGGSLRRTTAGRVDRAAEAVAIAAEPVVAAIPRALRPAAGVRASGVRSPSRSPSSPRCRIAIRSSTLGPTSSPRPPDMIRTKKTLTYSRFKRGGCRRARSERVPDTEHSTRVPGSL